MHVGRLAARVAIGSLFIGHGTQKLFGWFGGPGPEGTEGMMTSLNLHPPRRNALAAGIVETAGGALVVAGLATPLAAAGLIGSMTTAIRKVHWANGPWAANGGYEYNVVLIAALTALVETGPGDMSLDALLGRKLSGPAWALRGLLGRGHRPRQPLRARRTHGSGHDAVPGHRRGPGHLGLSATGRAAEGAPPVPLTRR
jgi:putative oxidoreductase